MTLTLGSSLLSSKSRQQETVFRGMGCLCLMTSMADRRWGECKKYDLHGPHRLWKRNGSTEKKQQPMYFCLHLILLAKLLVPTFCCGFSLLWPLHKNKKQKENAFPQVWCDRSAGGYKEQLACSGVFKTRMLKSEGLSKTVFFSLLS